MSKEIEDKSKELQRVKDENILLKATVMESDKTREIIVREMGHVKDIESDKVRSVETRKDAELKLQERLVTSLKQDKKELEQRIEEIILK